MLFRRNGAIRAVGVTEGTAAARAAPTAPRVVTGAVGTADMVWATVVLRQSHSRLQTRRKPLKTRNMVLLNRQVQYQNFNAIV